MKNTFKKILATAIVSGFLVTAAAANASDAPHTDKECKKDASGKCEEKK
jgi:hypothetical protein